MRSTMRIAHLSITNTDSISALPNLRGKAQLAASLKALGVSYCILRPTVLFGKEDVLINDIAWSLPNIYTLQSMSSKSGSKSGSGSKSDLLVSAFFNDFDFDSDFDGADLCRQRFPWVNDIDFSMPRLRLYQDYGFNG
jgi:hypothetical protein